MAALFILLLLGAGLVFMVQNQEPILLYFLGNSDKTALFSISLPVGLWVMGFILLGVLLSLLLQGLSRVGQAPAIMPSRPSPRSPRATKSPKPPVPPPPVSPPPKPEPPIADRWGWENPIPEADDWEVEDIPRSPIRPETQPETRPPIDIPARPVVSKTAATSKPVERANEPSRPAKPDKTVDPNDLPLRPEDLKEFETPQSPKTANREGNIYSYTYREKDGDRASKPSSIPSPKRVYDADYRVIKPPLSEPQEGDGEDEEDWV